MAMEIAHFERLVAEALEGLPQELREKLDNVAVTIEDWPSRADLTAAGLRPGQILFGLYQGVPHTQRTSHYGLVPPDRVTIFRGPILRVSRTEEDVRQEVRRVVLHELGHHFGLSDKRLRELGV